VRSNQISLVLLLGGWELQAKRVRIDLFSLKQAPPPHLTVCSDSHCPSTPWRSTYSSLWTKLKPSSLNLNPYQLYTSMVFMYHTVQAVVQRYSDQPQARWLRGLSLSPGRVKNFYFCIPFRWPPLSSSGQSSWLQIQRSRVRFTAVLDFLRSSGPGMGSTKPHEDNWVTFLYLLIIYLMLPSTIYSGFCRVITKQYVRWMSWVRYHPTMVLWNYLVRSSRHILWSLLTSFDWWNSSHISWLLWPVVRSLYLLAWTVISSCTNGILRLLCNVRFEMNQGAPVIILRVFDW
jgi:hypothetical protein